MAGRLHFTRVLASLTLIAAVAVAAPARAQVPTPPLPPIGGQPPPSNPPPSNPPPSNPPPSDPPPPGPPGPPAAPPATSGPPATVAEGANPARSGFVADYTLAPPLARRWSARSRAQFLLAADGRVFDIGTNYIRARGVRGGRLLWQVSTRKTGGTYEGSPEGAAYDRGIVFVQFFDDLVAYDAASGKQLWRHHFTEAAFAEQPVAGGGVVYGYFGQGGGTLVALEGANGHVLWSHGVVDGSGGAALEGDRLYLGGACANAEATSTASGEPIWRHSTGCSGGGSVLARLYGGRLWVPEQEYTGSDWLDPPILAADGGSVVGRTKIAPLVFADGVAIGNTEHGVVARDAQTGSARGGPAAGRSARPLPWGTAWSARCSESSCSTPRRGS